MGSKVKAPLRDPRREVFGMLISTATVHRSSRDRIRRDRFVDLAPVYTDPGKLQQVAEELARMVRGADQLASIGLGSLTFLTATSLQSRLPMLVLGATHEPPGTEGPSIGTVTPGKRVAIIHDVTNTGETIARLVSFLRASGGTVETAFVVVDREAGARLRLSKLSVSLTAIATLSDLVAARR